MKICSQHLPWSRCGPPSILLSYLWKPTPQKMMGPDRSGDLNIWFKLDQMRLSIHDRWMHIDFNGSDCPNRPPKQIDLNTPHHPPKPTKKKKKIQISISWADSKIFPKYLKSVTINYVCLGRFSRRSNRWDSDLSSSHPKKNGWISTNQSREKKITEIWEKVERENCRNMECLETEFQKQKTILAVFGNQDL